MIRKRIILVLALTLITFYCNGNTTETLKLIQLSYNKFLNTPLKISYQREICRFYGEDKIIERLPDGKVVVEISGSYVQQGEGQDAVVTKPKKTISINPVYNLPMDCVISKVTLWSRGKNFYAETQEASGGTTYQCFNGETYKKMTVGSSKKVKFGFTDTTDRGFDNIPSLIGWFSEQWLTPKEESINVIEDDRTVKVILEWKKLNQRQEIVMDKNLGYIPREKIYYGNDIITKRIKFEGSATVADINLPTLITIESFNSKNEPYLFIYYKNIEWESVAPETVAEKIAFEFPPDVIMATRTN